MRTVRRLYFYAVAFVSLEIVLWGLIGLGRSIACPGNLVPCGTGLALAEALALVLVGVPFFGFHWWFAQRMSGRDMEERSAGVRAFFLYAVLLSTLIPVVQNLLALVNRPALVGLRLSASRAFVGGQQTWSDNLIAVFMNLLAAAYFYSILRGDWKVIQPREAFADLRRLHRYIWMVYGLGLAVSGISLIVRFLMTIETTWLASDTYRYWGVNGMVMAFGGATVWAYAWLLVQKSLAEQAERESLLRLGLLYLLSLVGAVVTIASGGVIVDSFLRLAFGVKAPLAQFVTGLGGPVGICIPFAGIWAYYGGWLARTLTEVPEAPRRAGMRRLYFYILSGAGLTAMLTGLSALLMLVIDLLFAPQFLLDKMAANRLATALAILLAGLPLWLLTWRPMQADAFAKGDNGDHARRSIVRKTYLYLAIFVGVVGGMSTAIGFLTLLLRTLFGSAQSDLLVLSLHFTAMLFLFAGLSAYHVLALGRDGRLAASALAEKHAAFPVLVFDPGDGFGDQVREAFHKATPSLPVALQPLAPPPADSAAPQAVVLPSDLALDPPEPLRQWLGQFGGSRIVVPRATPGWHVVGQSARLPVNQAAQVVRQLAEGLDARSQGTPAWQIGLYIAAAIIGLPILASLVGTLVSSFLR